jgi:hypothetical protein
MRRTGSSHHADRSNLEYVIAGLADHIDVPAGINSHANGFLERVAAAVTGRIDDLLNLELGISSRCVSGQIRSADSGTRMWENGRFKERSGVVCPAFLAGPVLAKIRLERCRKIAKPLSCRFDPGSTDRCTQPNQRTIGAPAFR